LADTAFFTPMAQPPSPSCSPRHLRLQGLRSVDEAVVQIFLRMATPHLRCAWQLLESGPVDLLLLSPDASAPSAPPARATQVVWVVSRQHPIPAAGQPYLRQPLQYDAFLELLQSLEQRQRASEAPAITSAPAPTAAPTPALRLYRLKRWPAAHHLAQHRYHARLASFLSTRYLGLGDLIALSNVDAAVCTQFLQQMQALDLLDWREASPANRSETPPSPAPHNAAPAAMPGLIGRLRERLGLQRSAR